MQGLFLIIVVGVISGVAIGVQGPMASVITQKLGLLESVFIVHLGGALAALIPLIIIQKGGKLAQWRDLPWYLFLAGLSGMVVFAAISYLIPRIGVTSSMMLIIVGQFIIGGILDHYGWLGADVREFSLTKMVGLGVMMFGAWITIR